MKIEFGRTYFNPKTGEYVIAVSRGMAIGNDGVKFMSSWLEWEHAENTCSFERLCQSWGITEIEFEDEVNPMLMNLAGGIPERREGGNRIEEFNWAVFRRWKPINAGQVKRASPKDQ